VSKFDSGFTLLDPTALAITGIDPKLALVLQLAPGQTDDSGALGDYFLLIRGADTLALLCPYFDRASEATPRACK
jgi:hypothetical protein